VVLTDEAFPRFSVVRAPRHDRAIGPFRAHADAVDAALLLARFTGVRTCTTRLARAAEHGPQCPERELSPCPAPRGITAGDYAEFAERATENVAGVDDSALRTALRHIDDLAAEGRYETAARLRDHAATVIDGLWRGQRLRALTALPELVAARPDGAGGWHLVVVRYGQLAAAGNAPRRVPPMPVVEAISAAAQVILTSERPLGGAPVEEVALIVRWLAAPGVRIVRTRADDESGYCLPITAAGRWAEWAATARSARAAAQQAQRSDLLGEPSPPREQLLGSTRIDRLGGAGQTPLPRRHPLGVAG
jgi:DNA polymerase-3 subunit epsilon